jgi:hypothetical protein
MVLAEDRILPTKNGRRPRVNDPEGTKRNIVDVATREFAQKGYGGARVDAIAERTRTSKRMMYYYFGGKEGLYLAVLEEAYSSIRRTEPPSISSACRPRRRCAPWSPSPSTTTSSTPSSCAWS